MTLATQTLTLDLRPAYNTRGVVRCSQYDNVLRSVTFLIQNAGVDIDVSAYTVFVEGTKPDNTGFSYNVRDIGGTVQVNSVSVPIQAQMCAITGMVRAEIIFKNGSQRVGSANFFLAVEAAGLDANVDISETEIPAYIDAAEQAAETAQQAQQAAQQILDTSDQALQNAQQAEQVAQAALDQAVETAATIPQDYTALSNDVDDLKSANIYGNIVLVQEDENPKLHKAFSTYRSSTIPACFVAGYIFTDRLRVGYYFYSPYSNSKRQILISSATAYDPTTNGELTVENAEAKTNVSDFTTYLYYAMNKSGAVANTSWYSRPVLYVGEEKYYGDTWKFDIDANNNITATHVDNTFNDSTIVTNAYYAKAERGKWVTASFESEAPFYSLLVNSGIIDVNNKETRYAVINEDDFTGNNLGLTLCYQTGDGTRQFVDTVCPVDSVDKLPSDFSNIIAPTESAFKATRAYTVNDLIIIDNVLYKVTANIANGATITVGTNVQQTTLSALIKALSA